MRSTTVLLSASLAALLAGAAAAAADLEIVSTMTFESGGKKYVEPCVHNKAGEPRDAHFKVGGGAVRWTFPPIPVPPGGTVCRALDAPPIASGVPNEIHLE